MYSSLHYMNPRMIDNDDGHQESSSNTLNCEVSSISSPHLSNTSYSTLSDATSDEDVKSNTGCSLSSGRKITKQHKSSCKSPNKKKKRSLIGEIVMSSSNNGQLCSTGNNSTITCQQTQIVFENFEGRRPSTCSNSTPNHIPGTSSFSHKIDVHCNVSNESQPKSNMCEVILSNWKSRSDTRQWIKKCIGPQEKKKKSKKEQFTWCQTANNQTNTQFCNQPQPAFQQATTTSNIKFDRKPSNNNNTWSDNYIHTTCLIPGQRKVSKTQFSTMNHQQQSSSTCGDSVLSPPLPTNAICYSQAIVQSPHQQYGANPWLNSGSSASNLIVDQGSKHEFVLPSFREFVSTLGL